VSGLLAALVRARSSTAGVALEVLVACGVLARHHFGARLPPAARRAGDLLIVLALLAWGGLAALDAIHNVKYPRPWDFPSFYAVAHAAAHGRSFYDPHVLADIQAELARTQNVPSEWLNEVGYWYLPPSALLLLPLGWLSFRKAMIAHYLVQGLFLVGCAWLMRRRLPLGGGAVGVASALLLLLLFGPVQSTINFAQIVFGCLFFLLVSEALIERSPVASGASLAVGFFYKHLLLIPAMVFLVGRDRRARVMGIAALAGIVLALGASLAFFGRGVIGAYFANGPGARSPELAIDKVVQSLLALVYRALGATPHGSLLQIVLYPPFLVVAGALALATLALLWRSAGDARGRRLGFWLVGTLALLCYPNTLISTLALLVPALLLAYAEALEAGWPFALALALVAVVYGVAGALPVQAGWTALLVWVALAALMVRGRRTGATA